ncbi:hypothetical protein M408DRAFT_331419 [Serendipita vermifera MAFF 305830]|uniref:Uncharacterized protein n=1 Tax=Serendipita vermifera MAFF 305830 TaxID=933852 RepID=A0A0C2WFF9_SERVB|nr:hypothetical protein M408DRAFT_331419 [Serendipita vermifera MAFF 305830]
MAGYIGDTKYTGPERIVVAMDVGTTMTAVTFSYLYPDDYARVRMVNNWPGQLESGASSKIPSIVAYRQGKYKTCGLEALEYVEDDQYQIAKWFKLHLHPSSMKIPDVPPAYESDNDASSFEILPLPQGVPITQVYSDLFQYLMENIQKSFEQSIPNGPAVWSRLRDRLTVVLTTPNGWDFSQQSLLRKAAIGAGLVTEENSYELLDFITEGEASVHYALAYSQGKTWLDVNTIFAVVDAGGSTVDSTLYKCISTSPTLALEEVCPSECIQAGGIFVDRTAENMFKQKLSGSKWTEDECITEILQAFESRTKRIFNGSLGSYVVDFGSTRDNDRARGIIKGKLSVSALEVETTFEDVVQRTIASCLRLLGNYGVKYLLLVGGFGESQYLQKMLREQFESHKISIVTTEEPSEGAMIWYIKQSVMARIARTYIGVKVTTRYNPGDPEHVRRQQLTRKDLDGTLSLSGKFTTFVSKGTRLQGDFTHVEGFSRFYRPVQDRLGSYSCNLAIWEGEGNPSWVIDLKGEELPQLRRLCILKADLSGLKNSLKFEIGPKGEYYRVNFRVAIRFGGTQLQARLQWDEQGVLQEGPISIIPNAII